MNIPVENRTELAVISTVKMVENDLSDTCELKTYFTYFVQLTTRRAKRMAGTYVTGSCYVVKLTDRRYLCTYIM